MKIGEAYFHGFSFVSIAIFAYIATFTVKKQLRPRCTGKKSFQLQTLMFIYIVESRELQFIDAYTHKDKTALRQNLNAYGKPWNKV